MASRTLRQAWSLGLCWAAALCSYEARGGFISGMADVDKPTNAPASQHDGYGWFTNIKEGWTNTCWQAASASILARAGYECYEPDPAQTIYEIFYEAFGNVDATEEQWCEYVNEFICFESEDPLNPAWEARIESDPVSEWAERHSAEYPMVLSVDIGGGPEGEPWEGGHMIAYCGFGVDTTWIADSDGDFRPPNVAAPPVYENFSEFQNRLSQDHNWKLQREWSDGIKLTYDVSAALYLARIPEPMTAGSLVLGLAMLLRRPTRRRSA